MTGASFCCLASKSLTKELVSSIGSLSTASVTLKSSRLPKGDGCFDNGVAEPETARLGVVLDVANNAAT